VPFAIKPAADGSIIDVSFFGTASGTDWIAYGPSGGAVDFLEWFQDDADTYRVRVHTPADSWWGYDARYEQSTFVLELLQPPPLAHQDAPLGGLKIAVDAGHGTPDTGALGPTGLLEKDVNLAIANCLRDRLLAGGAEVIMIRGSDQIVGLYDRPQKAWEARADMLVSVHNNSLGYEGNPFERNGFGVYYFHPHSFPLARQIHQALAEVIGSSPDRSEGLRDDGLWYGNLAVARTPQMPAVLIEPAYMIVPREEALLKTEEFRCAVARAIELGISRYAASMRPGGSTEVQARSAVPEAPERGE
jgi:N-acetylmuramoyl-L-alanine amidase